jgi:dipeptidyl aminopeptidase/acylaminoacyl peptidase
MFHGTEDREVPIDIAADFHDRVAATGTPVELLAFAGEGHGLGMPVSQMTAAQAQIGWFRTHLVAPETGCR